MVLEQHVTIYVAYLTLLIVELPQVHDHRQTEVPSPVPAGHHGHPGGALDHLRHRGPSSPPLLHHCELRGGHAETETGLHHDLA